jgi:hypothetical protein
VCCELIDDPEEMVETTTTTTTTTIEPKAKQVKVPKKKKTTTSTTTAKMSTTTTTTTTLDKVCCKRPGIKGKLRNICRRGDTEVPLSKCAGQNKNSGWGGDPEANHRTKQTQGGGGGGLSAEIEGAAEAKGNTCVTKTPFGDKKDPAGRGGKVANEKNLEVLYNECLKEATMNSKMFVIYPDDANEKRSNCWLCSSEAVRSSKMKKAFLFKVSKAPSSMATSSGKVGKGGGKRYNNFLELGGDAAPVQKLTIIDGACPDSTRQVDMSRCGVNEKRPSHPAVCALQPGKSKPAYQSKDKFTCERATTTTTTTLPLSTTTTSTTTTRPNVCCGPLVTTTTTSTSTTTTTTTTTSTKAKVCCKRPGIKGKLRIACRTGDKEVPLSKCAGQNKGFGWNGDPEANHRTKKKRYNSLLELKSSASASPLQAGPRFQGVGKDGGSCADDPEGWKSSTGATCAQYKSNQWCNIDGSYGSGWEDSYENFAKWAVNKVDASQACCVCGGGSRSTANDYEIIEGECPSTMQLYPMKMCEIPQDAGPEPECPDPTGLPKGVTSNCEGGRAVGTVCSFDCEDGYKLSGKPASKCAVTKINGVVAAAYIGHTITCVPATCAVPKPLAKGVKTTCADNAPLGTLCAYECADGYSFGPPEETPKVVAPVRPSTTTTTAMVEMKEDAKPEEEKNPAAKTVAVAKDKEKVSTAAKKVRGKISKGAVNRGTPRGAVRRRSLLDLSLVRHARGASDPLKCDCVAEKGKDTAAYDCPKIVCTAALCPKPNDLAAGVTTTCVDDGAVGTKCRFACEPGYQVSGKTDSVCEVEAGKSTAAYVGQGVSCSAHPTSTTTITAAIATTTTTTMTMAVAPKVCCMEPGAVQEETSEEKACPEQAWVKQQNQNVVGGAETDLRGCEAAKGDIRGKPAEMRKCECECARETECAAVVFHAWGTMLKTSSEVDKADGFITWIKKKEDAPQEAPEEDKPVAKTVEVAKDTEKVCCKRPGIPGKLRIECRKGDDEVPLSKCAGQNKNSGWSGDPQALHRTTAAKKVGGKISKVAANRGTPRGAVRRRSLLDLSLKRRMSLGAKVGEVTGPVLLTVCSGKLVQVDMDKCVAPPDRTIGKHKALPPGMTCTVKVPVVGQPVTRENNLLKLYDMCHLLAQKGRHPLFVVYPKEARVSASNCWLCNGHEVRESKMRAAYLFKTILEEVSDHMTTSTSSTTTTTTSSTSTTTLAGAPKHPASLPAKVCCDPPGLKKPKLKMVCSASDKKVALSLCGGQKKMPEIAVKDSTTTTTTVLPEDSAEVEADSPKQLAAASCDTSTISRVNFKYVITHTLYTLLCTSHLPQLPIIPTRSYPPPPHTYILLIPTCWAPPPPMCELKN